MVTKSQRGSSSYSVVSDIFKPEDRLGTTAFLARKVSGMYRSTTFVKVIIPLDGIKTIFQIHQTLA